MADPYAFLAFRVAYEIASTIICIILVKFMIKPYVMTKESRYLGLPLGFGFLGATYALSALFYDQPFLLGNKTVYIQLALRTVAYFFLCLTYYFSQKKEGRFVWNTTFALVIIGILISISIILIPDLNLPSYEITSEVARIFSLGCLIYLCTSTIRSHFKTSNRNLILAFLGYLFLAMNQYLLIIYAIDGSYTIFLSAFPLRSIGLAMFLLVAYLSFFRFKGAD